MNPRDAGLIYILFGLGSLVIIYTFTEHWRLAFTLAMICSFIPIGIGFFCLLPDKPKRQSSTNVK